MVTTSRDNAVRRSQRTDSSWDVDFNLPSFPTERIEGLVGAFVADPDRCLELALAVRLLRLGRAKR